MHLRTPHRLAALSLAVVVLASACQGGSDDPDPDRSPTSSTSTTRTPTTEEPDVAAYESGPESPLGYGLEVPDGATQLGPLTRIRSDRLVAAYAPDLQAAQAQDEADQREQEAEDLQDDPSATPTTPSPTPDTRPSDDTFKPLEEQPRPDTVLSVMRVDGKPTQVVRRMLAQMAAMLPEADVPTEIAQICKARNLRITGCRLGVTGTTADDRDVRVILTVDPGDIDTRTAPPAAQTRPVMTLQITYVGDPRKGQVERESSDIGDVANIDDTADPDGLIWPSMDLDAPSSTALVDGFVVPADALLLLSGNEPAFVELTTAKAATADELAEKWVADRADSTVAKDVVEDLNEVSTTYSGSKGDTYYRATYVLSARGNYVLMMVYPPGYSH